MILTAYFDESGTHDDSPATILSGVMGTANQWARFQSEMNKTKARYGFTTFHAKDFKGRKGEFARWPQDKMIRVLNEMMVAGSKLMEAVTVTLPTDVYEEFYRSGENHRRLRLDTKYGLCFRYALLSLVIDALKRLSTHKKFSETKLNIVMESGHKNAGDAQRVFHEMQREFSDLGLHLLGAISFSSKNDPTGLADYLAYGGLAMEVAGENERRVPEPPSPSGMTGMSVIKMKPDALIELRSDLVAQLKKTGKARFMDSSGRFPSSREQPS